MHKLIINSNPFWSTLYKLFTVSYFITSIPLVYTFIIYVKGKTVYYHYYHHHHTLFMA